MEVGLDYWGRCWRDRAGKRLRCLCCVRGERGGERGGLHG